MSKERPETRDQRLGTAAIRQGSRSLVSGLSSLVSFRAFTLIELLVAAGITALLAGFIAVIVRNVSITWMRAGNRLGTDAQARLVLDQLQLDLQGAMYRDDGNVWFAVDLLNNSNGGATGLWQPAARNPKPTGGISLDIPATRAQLLPADRGKFEHARFGTAGVWLRFFTSGRAVTDPRGNITTPSAPVAVGYQIIRRFTATNPANRDGLGYLLHRVQVRPASSDNRPGVVESGYTIAGFDTQSNIAARPYTTSATNNTGARPDDPRSIQVVTTDQRNLDSVIVDNVIDFGVRCYVRDQTVPGGLRLIFPVNANGALSNSPQPIRSQLPSDTPPTAENYTARFLFPDVVDVMVRILTDEGAAAIANMERVQTPALAVPQKYNRNAQEWWWGVAQENSRVYTRRVTLNAQK